MELNDLLRAVDVDPKKTLVLRHRPSEAAFRKALPLLAGERLDLFDAYQSYQGEQAEQAFMKRRDGWLASFIEYETGKAIFVGIYRVHGAKSISPAEFWSRPEQSELTALGNPGWREDEGRDKRLLFDLERTSHYEDWRGKLVIGWPPVRIWYRRAQETPLPVLAIREDSAFAGDMPSWDQVDYSWAELKILPSRMKAALEQGSCG